jgi:hypothetical protein
MKHLRKRRFSPEHREKLSKARKGQKPTLGKHYSASTRKLMSERKMGRDNPMWGKKHTAQARARMSAAQKARGTRESATEKRPPVVWKGASL